MATVYTPANVVDLSVTKVRYDAIVVPLALQLDTTPKRALDPDLFDFRMILADTGDIVPDVKIEPVTAQEKIDIVSANPTMVADQYGWVTCVAPATNDIRRPQAIDGIAKINIQWKLKISTVERWETIVKLQITNVIPEVKLAAP
jgi:hypothetical protein